MTADRPESSPRRGANPRAGAAHRATADPRADHSPGRRPATGGGTARWIVVGLAIMIVSELATLARIEPFYSWNTPICWTGFIVFADAAVYRARGRSWMRDTPREFMVLALLSIPLWLLFEFYNLYLRNWSYSGLPQNWWLRMAGYAWAFATIWPAIFEAADLVGVWRGNSDPRDFTGAPEPPRQRPQWRGAAAASIAAGAVMVACPFVVPEKIAHYLAAPVWLGFIFLLEPLNRRLGAASLVPDGRANRAVNLMLSGFLCGILWEGWNFWAGTKWHYRVPLMENVKLFEMPLPGYFGFPAFALECFAMYAFVKGITMGTAVARRTHVRHA